MNCEDCKYRLSKFPFCSNHDIQKMIMEWKIENIEQWSKITDEWETDGTICGGYEYG